MATSHFPNRIAGNFDSSTIEFLRFSGQFDCRLLGKKLLSRQRLISNLILPDCECFQNRSRLLPGERRPPLELGSRTDCLTVERVFDWLRPFERISLSRECREAFD